MIQERWPHIGPEELRDLWDKHAPAFLRIDDLDETLEGIRDSFLAWLAGSGVDLGPPHAPGPRRRARLDRVSFTRLRDAVEAEVELSLNGVSVRAQRRGGTAADEAVRLPAEAALEAAGELFSLVEFTIEEAYTATRSDGDPHVVAIVLTRRAGDGFFADPCVGACRIAGSVPEAGAKAALDAINRRLEMAVNPPEARGV